MFLSNNVGDDTFTNWNQQKAQSALQAMGEMSRGSKRENVFPSITGLNKSTKSPSDKMFLNVTKSVPMSKLNEHPSWKCRRVGCSGFLTLLGSEVNSHIDNMNLSRSRAVSKRANFPATYEHGSPLTCSCCGDRPKPSSGRKKSGVATSLYRVRRTLRDERILDKTRRLQSSWCECCFGASKVMFT